MDNLYAPPQADVNDDDVATDGITNRMLDALSATRPWVMFLGILGFILSVFLTFVTLYALRQGLIPFILTMVATLMCYFISYHLVRYSIVINQLLNTQKPGDLEEALLIQKQCWKLIGITVLGYLLLWAVMIIAIIVMRSPGF